MFSMDSDDGSKFYLSNEMLIDLDELRRQLEKYRDREFKIGAFTACSNVTGVKTPYHQLAKLMHEYGGLVFVDFAASAPYMEMNMHPEDPMEKLDVIFFSPHKFLGGPGSSGVLVFDKDMYNAEAPDNPGGGTVDWTNPWGEPVTAHGADTDTARSCSSAWSTRA